MSLSVLTRSTTQDLVALATVKTRLGITDTSKDALLAILITAASAAISGYLGRPLSREQYQEARPGDGERRLLLPRYPIDPDSVTATIDGDAVTDFVIRDKAIGLLYRGSSWTVSTDADAPDNVTVTWKAGYVLPDQISTWATGAALTAGSWLRPTSPRLSPLLFEIAAGGTTSGSEPTWPTVTGGSAISLGGGVTVNPRDAIELPTRLADLAYVEVYYKYQNIPPGLSSIEGDGFSESYFATHTETELSKRTMDALDSLRADGIA